MRFLQGNRESHDRLSKQVGAKETVEHTCLTCKGLGFYDLNAMVKEAEERRKKWMEEE